MSVSHIYVFQHNVWQHLLMWTLLFVATHNVITRNLSARNTPQTQYATNAIRHKRNTPQTQYVTNAIRHTGYRHTGYRHTQYRHTSIPHTSVPPQTQVYCAHRLPTQRSRPRPNPKHRMHEQLGAKLFGGQRQRGGATLRMFYNGGVSSVSLRFTRGKRRKSKSFCPHPAPIQPMIVSVTGRSGTSFGNYETIIQFNLLGLRLNVPGPPDPSQPGNIHKLDLTHA